MKRQIVAALLVAALSGLVASGAVAANPAPAAAEVQPSPATIALVKRYFAAIHYERMVELLVRNLLPEMQKESQSEYSNLTADQRQIIGQAVMDSMPDFTKAMLEKAIPIYASTYTDQELAAMVAFYESPTGQAILQKSTLVTPKVVAALPSILPQFKAAIAGRIREKMKGLKPPVAVSPT